MDLGIDDGRRPTIADVPGLIEGARPAPGSATRSCATSSGRGCSSTSSTGRARDPEWDYDVIREELEAHDPALLEKPMLVAFNKLDLPAAADAWPAFRRRAADASGLTVVGISADDRARGSPSCASTLGGMLPSAAELGRCPPSRPASSSTASEAHGRRFIVVEREDGAFRVRGKRIERIAAQTDFENEESAERFQRDLARLGIDQELRRAGVVAGRLVRIGAAELEWERQPWERE